MQRFALTRDAAFIRIADAIEKGKFGNADRHHSHRLLNHRTMGSGAVLKASQPPPRWTSKELIVKALGAEGATARDEAILALQKLGLRLWKRYGAVIIA